MKNEEDIITVLFVDSHNSFKILIFCTVTIPNPKSSIENTRRIVPTGTK